MRVLVCGGRDFDDYPLLARTLDGLAEKHSKYFAPDDNWLPLDFVIISGAARGADRMAIDWAVSCYCRWEEYPADWEKHGTAAGPIRNRQMLEEGKPDLVVAFPGGSGTANMVEQAKRAGVKVVEVVSD